MTSSYPSVKQSFGALGIMLCIMIVTAPVYLALDSFAGKEITFFVYYVISMGGSVYALKRIRDKHNGVTDFNFHIENKSAIPLVMITIMGIVYGIESPISSLIPVTDSFKELLRDMFANQGVFTFLSIVVAAPVIEELIFRGIILDGFLKRYSPAKSIIISSALFGLIHLNPWQFISAFIGGCFMGWVYYRTRSISLSIIIHATNNLGAFIAMMFIDDIDAAMDESFIETYGGVLPAIAVVGVAVTVAAAGIYYLNGVLKTPPETINPLEVPEIVEPTPAQYIDDHIGG